jgi:hypothetical protein
MPNNTGKLSLGERLALVANKHSKAATQKRSNNNLRAKLAAITPTAEPVYSIGSFFSAPNTPKKNCGMKPPQFIGTKKNPAFNNWKKCSVAAGGKRTRKLKRSTRATRRHR